MHDMSSGDYYQNEDPSPAIVASDMTHMGDAPREDTAKGTRERSGTEE
jgi:hypothetical protein